MGWGGACIWILLISIFRSVLCDFENGDLKLNLVGEIADYGDFYGNNEINIFTFIYYKNRDMYTNVIFVYSLNRKENKYEITYVYEFDHKGYCEGMIVTDWTMDSRLDALLFLRDNDGIYIVGLIQSDEDQKSKFKIAWTSRDVKGSELNLGESSIKLAPEEARHNSNIHPLLCDINGDGLVDMVTQGFDGTRVVWINDDKKFIPYSWDDVPHVRFLRENPKPIDEDDVEEENEEEEKVIKEEEDINDSGMYPITVPHSNAFVDINADCRPDLVFTVKKDNCVMVEIWLSDVEVGDKGTITVYTRLDPFLLPRNPGQLIYADFTGDGSIDIGIPSCTPDEENPKLCKRSGFFLMMNRQKPLCNNLWNNSGVQCRNPTELCEKTPFNLTNYQSIYFDNSGVSGANPYYYTANSNFGKILKYAYGDFDFDGYPDLAFIASNITSPDPTILIYKNMLYDRDSKFSLVKSIPIDDPNHNYILSFFDVFEDGDQNILLFGLPNEDEINKNIFEKSDDLEKNEENLIEEQVIEEQVIEEKEKVIEENAVDNRDDGEAWKRLISVGVDDEGVGHSEKFEHIDSGDEVSDKSDDEGTVQVFSIKKNEDTRSVKEVVVQEEERSYDMSNYEIDYLPFTSYKWRSSGFGLFLKASSIGPLSNIHFQDDIKVETNLHGPVFMITVSDIYGEKSPRQAIQRPLSGYTPLQLPYVIFGLGNTNNYVEEFYLGVSCASKDYKNMWISIIPNCFVMAVTFPLDIPSKWNLKLSINPSKKFMPILFTNLACLGIIGLFIIVFHAREKKEDSENEKGFKQKFIAH